MKKIIYIYILESMADWEIANLLQAISMQGMVNNEIEEFEIKTVACNSNPIKTMGGLTIIPDCSLEEIDEDNIVALILPGAKNWSEDINKTILMKLDEYINKGILIAAICGATVELANLNILDKYKHTSNALDYLTLFSKEYKGKDFYIDAQAVIDRNIITASSVGGLLFAKYIIEYLGIFTNDKIESWYNYCLTGDSKYFFELIS